MGTVASLGLYQGLRMDRAMLHLLQLFHLEQMEPAMSDLLVRDAAALHRALATSGDEVKVALSRETAELVSRLVDARARGEEILVSRGHAEVTPTEAAVLLGMSSPQVRKLMDRGLLEFRKVGTHHRVRVSSIRAFLESERPRRREALADLADVQNELGLTG
jgi:excisionase family DNA binding protein